MESPGEYLKRERELRRSSLTNIFEATRVPLKCLAALEADDYESLPHPTFVKGYIRAYCKCLGLDETDAILRYEMYMREKSDRADKAEPVRPAPALNRMESKDTSREARILNNAKGIAVLAGVALIIILFYSVYSRHKARVPENEALKRATSETAIPKPEAAPAPQAKIEGQAAAKVKEPGNLKNTSVPAAGTADAKPADKKHTLVINATEDVWIKVKIDGGEPFDATLRKGNRVVWKAADTFYLVVGNAGGVDITYDGEKLSSLGTSGDVVSLKLPLGE